MANIGKSISIKGDLTGNEDIVIEGNVEGKVNLPDGQLTIGAAGTVKGEVQAKTVVIVGRVLGNVSGLERVEVQGSGVVEGDVTSPRLTVAEGAVLNGTLKVGAQASSSKASTAQAPSQTQTPTRPPATGDVRRAG